MSLVAQNKELQSQYAEVVTRNQKLSEVLADVDGQKADLIEKQQNLANAKAAFDRQQQDFGKAEANFDQQQQDFAKAKTVFEQQQQDFGKAKAIFDQRQQDFAKAAAALDQQRADFQAKQKEFAQLLSANSVISAAAQCDALTAYQYDSDRPANSGWVDSNKDIPDAAQAICKGALDQIGSSGDPKARRRIMLELGRVVQEKDPPAALKYWTDAAGLGSSHAYYILARYYADHHSSKAAWDNLKRAADMDPADQLALYYVAYSHLFPGDKGNLFVAPQPDSTSGEEYLQKALNADYKTAFYIAGVHYWRTNQAQAKIYLWISWCIKHYVDDDNSSYNADSFYFQKTKQRLSCQ